MAALDAGYDITASGVTLDRFCGSGITSVNFAAATVMAGMEDLVIAGGTEMMSSYAANVVDVAPPFLDSGNVHLRAIHPQTNQGVCADAIATLERIDRQAVDALAAETQRRAEIAIKEGRFDKEPGARATTTTARVALDREEYPRPGTTADSLASLPSSFEALADVPLDENGTTYRSLVLQKFPGLEIKHVHHAGNSSGVVDGAAALLLTSPEYAKAHGLKPRARIVAMANMGDDPTLMLNAPVPATRKVLAKAGLALDDIDLFEVNEAFAVVPEKFIRDLDIDREKVNVNGGAIALGPPDRRHRLDPGRHGPRRARAPGQAGRAHHHVRRRWHGAGRDHRAGLGYAGPDGATRAVTSLARTRWGRTTTTSSGCSTRTRPNGTSPSSGRRSSPVSPSPCPRGRRCPTCAGARTSPSSSSCTAGRRTRTPGTPSCWPSAVRRWRSTCPGTGTRTGAPTATTGPGRTPRRWPRFWSRWRPPPAASSACRSAGPRRSAWPRSVRICAAGPCSSTSRRRSTTRPAS